MLCDLVPAKLNDGVRVAKAMNPAEELGGIDVKGIDSIKLAQLHALVTKQSYEDVLDDYDPLETGTEDEGPWVFRVPNGCTDALAKLDAAGRKRIAKEWAKMEEFEADGWTASAVAKTLDSICDLAKKTHAAKKVLFLWVSL